mgnify:CR=1 FL=1
MYAESISDVKFSITGQGHVKIKISVQRHPENWWALTHKQYLENNKRTLTHKQYLQTNDNNTQAVPGKQRTITHNEYQGYKDDNTQAASGIQRQ